MGNFIYSLRDASRGLGFKTFENLSRENKIDFFINNVVKNNLFKNGNMY